MTDRQEIRAKSAELAIRLLDVAIGPIASDKRQLIPKSTLAGEGQAYFDAVTNLAGQFETFILDVPANT
jgi:hypothetical protein